MKSRLLAVTTSALILIFTGTMSYGADQDKTQTQSKTQAKKQQQAKTSDNDTVYGWELMSVKERQAHRAKMKKLKSQKARTAYLDKHHKMMEKRAKERGVTLPDTPMMGNGMGNPGAGRGAGAGAGPGPGAGAGSDANSQ